MKGVRADICVVEQRLAVSRTQAQSFILAGLILQIANEQRINKPGQILPLGTQLRKKGNLHSYVSRGGLKLQAALQTFSLMTAVKNAVCLDIGASTGGFTDCLLQHGAQRVYAVDVGYGQLAWSLRENSQVVVCERVNARRLTDIQVPQLCDIVVIDVSFIALHLVLPAVLQRLRPGGHLVALVKPQFEVGRAHLSKGGIVRDSRARAACLARITALVQQLGGDTCKSMTSPILGAKGNSEYLLTACFGTAVLAQRCG